MLSKWKWHMKGRGFANFHEKLVAKYQGHDWKCSTSLWWDLCTKGTVEGSWLEEICGLMLRKVLCVNSVGSSLHHERNRQRSVDHLPMPPVQSQLVSFWPCPLWNSGGLIQCFTNITVSLAPFSNILQSFCNEILQLCTGQNII